MQTHFHIRSSIVLAALALLVGMPVSAQTVIVPINPTATYLRVSSMDNTDGPVLDSIPYALSAADIHPGDVVRFTALGGFSFAIGQPDTSQDTIAVFSTSNVLLPADQPFRVPGAVSGGPTFTTPNTFFGNLVTDIPQDFNFGVRTGGSLTLTVPQGAQFLFFSVSSSAFSDNRDPNGDYAARIRVISRAVPEPGSLALLTSMAVTGTAFLHRRKQTAKAA